MSSISVSDPFPIEDFVASAVQALKTLGDARAIAILLEGQCYFSYCEQDWNIDFWNFVIGTPVHLYHVMSEFERKSTEKAICKVISPFFRNDTGNDLRGVQITPLVSQAQEGWRDEALRFIKGEGLTNQGRVRSDNIASKQFKGLLFRSEAEIVLFEALTRAQLAVAPLPVFIRIGKVYNRLEPDFVIVFKGLTFIVEVDGDTYHKELPAEADKRLVPLTYEGVEVKRIRASELTSSQAADEVVKDLIQFMSRRKEAR